VIKAFYKDRAVSEEINEADRFDTILFAMGRQPNVNSLNLQEANVDFSEKDGIYANKFLQTSNPDVYSVGDCLAAALSKDQAEQYPGCGPQFTHNSDVQARSIFKNALLGEEIDRTKTWLPWTTYTEPEISHVGKYGHELDKEGV